MIATPYHKSLPYYEIFNDISERSFANAVMNFRVLQTAVISRLAEDLSASQERLYFMKFGYIFKYTVVRLVRKFTDFMDS